MSRFSILVGMMLGCTVIGGAVSAQTITAFDLAAPVNGNQQYGATIGVPFTVNSAIIVTSLGAFDAAVPATGLAHTLNGTIVTTIYNTVTQTAVPGLSATFTAGSPGTLTGGNLFKPVTNILLPAGNYVLAWTSITNNDQNGNSTMGGFTADTYNTGGGLITINTTQFRYNTLGVSTTGLDKFPTTLTSGQLNAGSFQFTANTPEPGAVTLFGSIATVGVALFRRRRKQK